MGILTPAGTAPKRRKAGNQTSEWLRSIGQGDLAATLDGSAQSPAAPMALAQGAAPSAPPGVSNLSPEIMSQYQNMTPEERQAFVNRMLQGMGPVEAMQPEGFAPYDPRQDQGAMGGPEQPIPAQMQLTGGGGDDALIGQAGGLVNIDTGAGVEDLNARSYEARAGGYALRSQASHEIITRLEGQGTEFWSNQAENLPFGVGNYLVDSDFQMFDQARRDFINAVLRRESGAVISDSEFENGNLQYFPQPGDGPEVIEQKRINRENAIRSMRLESGRAVGALPEMGGGATHRFNVETGEVEEIQ